MDRTSLAGLARICTSLCLLVWVGSGAVAKAQTTDQPADGERSDGDTPSEPTTDCVSLTDRFSSGDRLRRVLLLELAEQGVTLAPSTDEESRCFPVSLERISDSVAVIELAGDRSRVVDLSTVAPELRPRGLALAVAEEFSTLRSNAPELRAVPDPNQPPTPREPPDTQGTADSNTVQEEQIAPHQDVGPPPRTASLAVVIAAGGGRFLSSEPNVFQGQLGAELGVGVDWGRLRFGVEVSYGTQRVSPFGDFSLTVFSGWIGWNFILFQSDAVDLLVMPTLSAGATWLQGKPETPAAVVAHDAIRVTSLVSVAGRIQVHLSRQLHLEFGPTVGGVLFPVDVLGNDEVVGGLSGVYLGGTVGILAGF